MASPLSSSEQSSIQNIESQLEDYIKEAEKGKLNPDDKMFKHIQEELKALLKNKNIPDNVKQYLQQAAKDLKVQKGSGTPELDNVIHAKSQLDEILGGGGTELS